MLFKKIYNYGSSIFEIIKLLELKIFHRKYNYIFNFLCANITCYQESMIFFCRIYSKAMDMASTDNTQH